MNLHIPGYLLHNYLRALQHGYLHYSPAMPSSSSNHNGQLPQFNLYEWMLLHIEIIWLSLKEREIVKVSQPQMILELRCA